MFGIPLHCLRTPVSSDPSTAVLVELCRLPAFIQVPVKRLLLLCCCCCRCCGCCCGSEFYFTYSTHTYVVFVVFSLVLADLLRHTKKYTLHHYGYIAAALLGCGHKAENSWCLRDTRDTRLHGLFAFIVSQSRSKNRLVMQVFRRFPSSGCILCCLPLFVHFLF